MISEASAPGKVILFGEHFVVYGVKAVLCAINKRISARSRLLDEKKVIIKSLLGTTEVELDRLDPKMVSPRFMKPFFQIVKNIIDEHRYKKGIEVEIISEIPPGIGLGSSSAACVAVAASVACLFEKLPKERILNIATMAERTIFSEASGADSSVSTYGGLISFDRDKITRINSTNDFSLVIINSNQVHDTSKVVKSVKEFKAKNSELFSKLCQQENIIIGRAELALEENNLSSLGSLMSENQKILDQIGVSTSKIDGIIQEAGKTAYGAKMTGAGGGGCVICLVDKTNAQSTIENLKRFGDCFVSKIDYNGLTYLQQGLRNNLPNSRQK